jgi:hypothetical protein
MGGVANTIRFGTDLAVTDQGAGVIRVDVTPAKVDRDAVAAATARLVAVKLASGDAQPAFQINGDGKLQWGPGGTTALDTNLYRGPGPGFVKTDTALVAGTNLYVGNNVAAGAIYFDNAASVNISRTAPGVLTSSGHFHISKGPSGGAATGLWIDSVDVGAERQVQIGAIDSGGAGFRMLKVPN